MLRCKVMSLVGYSVIATSVILILRFVDRPLDRVAEERHLMSCTEPRQSCEDLDIVFVLGGHAVIKEFSTLLKSMLKYRRNVLNLHMIVDPVAHEVVKVLMDTWQIPDVNTRFYPAGNVTDNVAWVPNSHYSGIYGLLKLTIPSVVQNVKTALVLDTDVILTTDIADIFDAAFRARSHETLFSLVENMSAHYKKEKAWPAVRYGFNTGVMVLELQRMRDVGWNLLWTETARRYLPSRKTVVMADQDIINAVCSDHPHLCNQLPAVYNVQFSQRAMPERRPSVSEAKVIHWNTPAQQSEWFSADGVAVGQFFRDVTQLDGYMFREKKVCADSPAISTTIDPTVTSYFTDVACDAFLRQTYQVFRTHIFVLPYQYTPVVSDVTLVTQLSVDRAYMLEFLVGAWSGPVSVAVYLSDFDLPQFLEFVTTSPILAERKNVAYHVVYRHGSLYPVNRLRNVALSYVDTAYVFVLDIDFVPSVNAYEQIRHELLKLEQTSNVTSAAIVIPAFQLNTVDWRSKIPGLPASMVDLQNMVRNASVSPFNADVWPKGHAPTNYTRWFSAQTPYPISWAMDFEPYVVLRVPAPLFDEQFSGFGWNKVAYAMELYHAGYKFVVLPRIFVTHVAHPPSADVQRFRHNPVYRKCVKLFKSNFMKRLVKLHGIMPR